MLVTPSAGYVRDTKNRTGPTLTFGHGAFSSFLGLAKAGVIDKS